MRQLTVSELYDRVFLPDMLDQAVSDPWVVVHRSAVEAGIAAVIADQDGAHFDAFCQALTGKGVAVGELRIARREIENALHAVLVDVAARSPAKEARAVDMGELREAAERIFKVIPRDVRDYYLRRVQIYAIWESLIEGGASYLFLTRVYTLATAEILGLSESRIGAAIREHREHGDAVAEAREIAERVRAEIEAEIAAQSRGEAA